jgi:hypothetical protein
LVNRNGVSIHHVANSAWFWPVAFIFGERAAGMVNRWCGVARSFIDDFPRVNLTLNRICLNLEE